MRILIIEDNQQIARALARGLESYYAVDVVFNGADGLFQVKNFSYDAVVLDLNLPDMQGAVLCQQLRKEGQTVPVLILTGQTDIASKVELLDIGADDYLTKPFSLEEI